MRRRLWLLVAAALAALVLLILGYRWLSDRYSLRGRFERVSAGMSEAEVLAIMGPYHDTRSVPWPPQVSEYAEVWRIHDGKLVRQEYRGIDVHTQVHLAGPRYSVWKADDGVVIIGYAAAGRLCGKIRLTEGPVH